MKGLKNDVAAKIDRIGEKIVKTSFLIDPLTGQKIFPQNSDFFHIKIDAASSN